MYIYRVSRNSGRNLNRMIPNPKTSQNSKIKCFCPTKIYISKVNFEDLASLILSSSIYTSNLRIRFIKRRSLVRKAIAGQSRLIFERRIKPLRSSPRTTRVPRIRSSVLGKYAGLFEQLSLSWVELNPCRNGHVTKRLSAGRETGMGDLGARGLCTRTSVT